jgi:hypothetical protein
MVFNFFKSQASFDPKTVIGAAFALIVIHTILVIIMTDQYSKSVVAGGSVSSVYGLLAMIADIGLIAGSAAFLYKRGAGLLAGM